MAVTEASESLIDPPDSTDAMTAKRGGDMLYGLAMVLEGERAHHWHVVRARTYAQAVYELANHWEDSEGRGSAWDKVGVSDRANDVRRSLGIFSSSAARGPRML